MLACREVRLLARSFDFMSLILFASIHSRYLERANDLLNDGLVAFEASLGCAHEQTDYSVRSRSKEPGPFRRFAAPIGSSAGIDSHVSLLLLAGNPDCATDRLGYSSSRRL